METTRVDFHLHSTYSDGALGPTELVERLAADEVSFAALTDRDSVEGLSEFAEAASRHGIGTITGVELTARYGEYEAHVLGYGFDPQNHGLLELLGMTARTGTLHAPDTTAPGLEGSPNPQANATDSAVALVRDGRRSVESAIRVIHEAGGMAFLAHPLETEPDPERLRALLAGLSEMGLDGIASTGKASDTDAAEKLAGIAAELNLLVCAGTNLHRPHAGGESRFGVEMPTGVWKRFRDAVSSSRQAGDRQATPDPTTPPRARGVQRRFLLHVVFPTLLALGLFALAMFGVVLPRFEQSLTDRKRETIRELTQSAWSILEGYEADAQAGVLTRAEAQQRALEQIERLRYGPENKDYFWLQDLQPRMIMHPYRKDLNGRDVSGFTDPTGAAIFVEFAQLVRRQQEGYIDYVWQWKDDPTRLAPKQSYIKGFEPWGWIIGTGIYTEDVRGETHRLKQRLLQTLGTIAVIVAGLLLYVVRQGMQLERRRQDAEESLRESTERYRSLVEATTEGTLLVVDGRCRYANPRLLELLGAGGPELELLDLEDIIPRVGANSGVWERLDEIRTGAIETIGGVEGLLRRRDGTLTECTFAFSRISLSGREGLIVLATPLGLDTTGEGAGSHAGVGEAPGALSERLPAGLFRARATETGTVVSATPSAMRLLRTATGNAEMPLTLAELFDDREAYGEFLGQLTREGQAERRMYVATMAPGTHLISVRAIHIPARGETSALIEGIIEEVADHARQVAECEMLRNRLQASVLFLHDPIGSTSHRPVFCPMTMTAGQAAEMMSRENTTALLVRAPGSEVIGIFTDRDLRDRVIAVGAHLATPVYRVMSSPLVTVPEDAEVHEALLLVERDRIQHVAVSGRGGEITGVIEDHDLLTFRDYGPIVLTHQIARAEMPSDVAAAARHAPEMGRRLMDGGAEPYRVTRTLTSVCDAATRRLIELAIEKLGPAPAQFAFLAAGSHGREEITFVSDQVSALVYADDADEGAGEYFAQVGRLVTDGLRACGYPLCMGGAMASNPRWCQPLSVWETYFTDWTREARPEQVAEVCAFIDFRMVSGNPALADALRAHLHEEARRQPAFLLHMAHNAMLFEPPAHLTGRRPVGPGDEDTGALNIREAISPIVDFARLYALRHGLGFTHTLERLDALVQAAVLAEVARNDTRAAWDLLMRLRLSHQIANPRADRAPEGIVGYATLTQSDVALLNHAFTQISAIQKRIGHDFPGGDDMR